ncbi:unnamed protein product [Orchesella dallaii]|uniref:Ubiquitin-like domain-containing protein n=1 Tax=Orchesella dallaii TaxID=48710 RepID=A0ABP1RV17_9HEXA
MSSSDSENALASPPPVAGASAESTNAIAMKPKLTIAVASKNGNCVCVKCRPSVTIKQLAELYAKLTKTPLSQVHLSYNKCFRVDYETLEDAGVENNKIVEVHSNLWESGYPTVEYLFHK